jgi:hypothetical protein
MRAPVVLFLASLAAACPKPSTDQASTGSPPPASSVPQVEANETEPPPEALALSSLAPLSGTWLERLDLGDGGAAFVSVPLGATEPRPIMVAVHGAGDRPEWACGGWRGVTNARSFIVCPQGTPTADGRFYWPSTAKLRSVIDGALLASRARYGNYLLDGPMVYAGFSAGVIYGTGMLRDDGARFPLLMLSEGGYDELADASFAARFRMSGGQRVLLGCSTGGCAPRLDRARTLLEKAGIPARLNDAGHLGHNLDSRVVTSLQRDWPWLVEGAPGW